MNKAVRWRCLILSLVLLAPTAGAQADVTVGPGGGTPGHSAVPFFGRPFVLITDEVYGTFTDPDFGCPWGWARTL